MGNKSANAVLDRLLEVYGVTTDNQLSEIIKVNRSTLGNWRSRDSVPYTYCVIVAEEKGISLDWLLTGFGPKHRNAHAEQLPIESTSSAVISFTEEDKKRITELEARLKELEAAIGSK